MLGIVHLDFLIVMLCSGTMAERTYVWVSAYDTYRIPLWPFGP